MDSIVENVGMPLDEYMRLYEEQPFELINGEKVIKMPNVIEHGDIIELMYLAIYMIVSAKQLGKIIREMPFVLSYTSNWVTGSRIPDLMYYTAERLAAFQEANPNYKKMPYVLVPDLVIEVVSPNDNLSILDEKVDQYLLDGVQIVWVLDPQKQRASVSNLIARQPFTKQQTHLTPTDTLTGGDLIPGFEIQIASIFA
ncbi:MAG: Uma2 family endonuclease [Anaerolineae bacterium]|nr:Uma2 family endonuclease [Anaerolineae bacterium]